MEDPMLLPDQAPSSPEAPVVPAGPIPRLAKSGPLGHLSEFRDNPLAVLQRAFRTHGDLVTIDLVRSALLVSHPDGVKHVLQDRHTNYGRPFFYRRMKRLVGNGLLTNDTSSWLSQRRLASPAFHRKRIASLQGRMVARTHETIARVQDLRTSVDMAEEMVRLTLGIAGDTLFSIDLLEQAKEVGEAAAEALRITNARGNQIVLWPQVMPTPQNVRFGRVKAVLDNVVADVIAERRKSGPRDDLLQMFMDAEDQDTGERMNDQQLKDEVLTMLLAGHETTAHALSWGLMLLSRHPEVVGRMRAELDAQSPRRDPDAATVMGLETTRRVVHEVLRLYPSAWLISREALDDDVIMGQPIKKGTDVLMSPWLVHRHPQFWPNPEAFLPDRFSPEQSEGRHRMAWLPFAAGPRMCVGSNFALMEMMTILPMLVRALEFELVPGYVIDPEPTITLRPRHGIEMNVRRFQPN